ncbi:glycosyltransferase [Dokdonella soli]|uniref:Glycosyltransferase family 2 protein n=1 Tax=Dokdonella soli TaxID=529810 RepID=A0ABP3TK58_9GAMM
MTRLVVVTPVYEDAGASGILFRELESVFGDRLFVVAVDDGSVREPVDPAALASANVSGVVITLRRNVGHQRAIAIGLNYVVAEVADAATIVVMDSDGEDIPQSIVELVKSLEADDVDVVVAERRSRVETLRFRIFYLLYKRLFSVLSGRKISFGNFMAMKPLAAKRLAAMQELWIHVAASVLTSKLRVATCPLDRGPRFAGKSKMNFAGLALHGFRGLMVFAEDVLLRVGIASAMVAAFCVIAAVTAVFLKLNGFATPGWFSVALGVLFIVLLQIGAITLISLMLTGVMRYASATVTDYREFIDKVQPVERAR